MLVRSLPTAAGIVMACFYGGLASVDAQVVEPDAPERAIAGCYSTHPVADFPLVDPLPGREDRYQLPDTINLTLQLRTVGWSFGGSTDWRQSGHFLGVDPALLSPGALHRFDAWQLSGVDLSVRWDPISPDGGAISMALNSQDQDGAWRGIATLAFADQRYQTGVVLRPVACPPPEYWREQRIRILRRWTPLPDVNIELGQPIVLPPFADTASSQPLH